MRREAFIFAFGHIRRWQSSTSVPSLRVGVELVGDLLLAGVQSTIRYRAGMSPGDDAVDGEEPVDERQHLGRAGSVSPITHEVAEDGEHRDDVDTSTGHTVVRIVTNELRGGSRGLDVGPDTIALLPERIGQESGAYAAAVR